MLRPKSLGFLLPGEEREFVRRTDVFLRLIA